VTGAHNSRKHAIPLLESPAALTLASQLLHKTLKLVLCCLAKGHQRGLWTEQNNGVDRLIFGKVYVLHLGHITPHPPGLMQSTEQQIFQICDMPVARVKADLPFSAFKQMP
jgi:hypothetical protein